MRVSSSPTDAARVRAAIAQLPPTERDLLVLRFSENLGTGELAAVIGTTPAMVLRGLHHAGWVVEDVAGVSPAVSDGAGPPLLVDRPAALVEEEASVGITPLLAARLADAVAGELPPADRLWRFRSVVRDVRARADGVLTALLLAAVALPAIVATVQL